METEGRYVRMPYNKEMRMSETTSENNRTKAESGRGRKGGGDAKAFCAREHVRPAGHADFLRARRAAGTGGFDLLARFRGKQRA